MPTLLTSFLYRRGIQTSLFAKTLVDCQGSFVFFFQETVQVFLGRTTLIADLGKPPLIGVLFGELSTMAINREQIVSQHDVISVHISSFKAISMGDDS